MPAIAEPLGESNLFVELLEQVSRLAPLNKPVLIVGERGTGKELIAHRLHYLSKRWQNPYLAINCSTLSESLLESELFGHEAGAFTGATKRHQGRFERAHGGTLFLDELATASQRVQEKLLRVIEYGELERVGGAQPLRVDVRVIAATHADLPALAQVGQFRYDLLDRLAFDVITLPPLRERPEDILLLANHFAIQMAQELNLSHFAGFTPSAEQALRAYPWWGNVRELKNVIERSLFHHYHATGGAERPLEVIDFDPFATPWNTPSRVAPRRSTIVKESEEIGFPCQLVTELQKLELSLLKRALSETNYNQRKAAELLGLSYHQLRGLLRKPDHRKELNLDRAEALIEA